jgi:mannosyltransferase
VTRVRADIAIVGLLTVAALALRVAGMGQSLFGDELFTYGDLASRGLGGVVHRVAYGGVEDNPPLFYVLAELSSHLGQETVWLRLPSVLLGAATVPLVYAAGRLAVGERAGLWGAALWVLSPFVLFYGTEGRAYATMAFFVVLSTVGLLCALRSGGRRWWALYALAACAAMYSQYAAVFALAAQAGWAFLAHPGARRALLLATAAAALAFLPWLPALLSQQRDGSAAVIGAFYPVTLRSVGEALVRQLFGHPFVAIRDLPGTAGLVLLGAGGVALVAATVRAGRGRLAAGPALIAALALATPVGALLYGALGTAIFSPRNLTASIPAVCLLIGWLVARLPARAELVAGAAGRRPALRPRPEPRRVQPAPGRQGRRRLRRRECGRARPLPGDAAVVLQDARAAPRRDAVLRAPAPGRRAARLPS